MAMQRYVDQLIDELRVLQERKPPSVDRRLLDPDMMDLPDHLQDVETYLRSESQGFPDLFGLPAEAFPPQHRLTTGQMQSIVNAIEELWMAWGIHAYIRREAPAEVIYRVLIRYWREEGIHYFSPSPDAFIGLELCPYDPDQCEWGSYCTCREFREEMS